MNPMRATISILMALLIQPAFPQDKPSLTDKKQKAEQGHASAQHDLGFFYHHGLFVYPRTIRRPDAGIVWQPSRD